MSAHPPVVIAVSDLLFQTRIEGAARHAGFETRTVTGDTAMTEPLDGAIVVVDLHETSFEAERLIKAANEARGRVLAFGRHTEPATLRRAREAGADRVVARSQLVEELPELLRSLAEEERQPQPQ